MRYLRMFSNAVDRRRPRRGVRRPAVPPAEPERAALPRRRWRRSLVTRRRCPTACTWPPSSTSLIVAPAGLRATDHLARLDQPPPAGLAVHGVAPAGAAALDVARTCGDSGRCSTPTTARRMAIGRQRPDRVRARVPRRSRWRTTRSAAAAAAVGVAPVCADRARRRSRCRCSRAGPGTPAPLESRRLDFDLDLGHRQVGESPRVVLILLDGGSLDFVSAATRRGTAAELREDPRLRRRDAPGDAAPDAARAGLDRRWRPASCPAKTGVRSAARYRDAGRRATRSSCCRTTASRTGSCGSASSREVLAHVAGAARPPALEHPGRRRPVGRHRRLAADATRRSRVRGYLVTDQFDRLARRAARARRSARSATRADDRSPTVSDRSRAARVARQAQSGGDAGLAGAAGRRGARCSRGGRSRPTASTSRSGSALGGQIARARHGRPLPRHRRRRPLLPALRHAARCSATCPRTSGGGTGACSKAPTRSSTRWSAARWRRSARTTCCSSCPASAWSRSTLGKRLLERVDRQPRPERHARGRAGRLPARLRRGGRARAQGPRARSSTSRRRCSTSSACRSARDMDGYARTDIFRRAFTSERPITFIPTYDR